MSVQNRPTMQAVIAVLVVLGGGLSLIFANNISDTTRASIINLMIMVVSYYFGSSNGSKRKDELIDTLSKKD